MASVDRFEIDVVGMGIMQVYQINVLTLSLLEVKLFSSLQTIVSRSLNGFSDAVISVTRFKPVGLGMLFQIKQS